MGGKGGDGDPDAFFAKKDGFGYNDLCSLPKLSKDAILANLKKRFQGEVVYTYVGDIIVSVNPFKNTGSVGKDIRKRYKTTKAANLPPHIYALVDATYSQMMENSMSQSVLISGESGAGKTEAMKICLSFLGELSQGATKGKPATDDVAAKLMMTNPVMEATGNAKTIRNNNSSRFGKHFDVQFGDAGEIKGAFTSVYLLEKPRITNHMNGERNYHVFYMLCKASDEVRSPVQLSNWQDFSILNQKGTVAEVTSWNDNAEFRDMHAALLSLGFSQSQRHELYLMLSTCLHTGNIDIKASGQGSAVSNQEQLSRTAGMLQVPPEDLARALTSRTMGGGAIEAYNKPLEPREAEAARASLVMHIYSLVFDWCVDVINDYIATANAEACIGILDIFGFENFSLNSFPQLCINFTNESLHNLFIEHVFKLEQQTYVAEEVDWNFIDYEDNQHVLDLIAKRPMCVLGQLDEACTNQAATDTSLLENMHGAFAGKNGGPTSKYKAYVRPKKSADRTFAISHYAGEVTYTIEGFVSKNKDALSVDISALLEEKSMWEQLRQLAQADRQRKEDATASAAAKKGGKGGGSKKKTVGRTFGESLEKLNSKLRSTEKHYIRCLKPNQTLQPGDWDPDFMFKQLAYSGTMEVTEIRKAGLNVRRPLRHFYMYYKVCADDQKALQGGETLTERTKILLAQLPLDPAKYRVGKTIMFLQVADLLDELDAIREEKVIEYVIHLQSLIRMVRERKVYQKIRRCAMRVQGMIKSFEIRRAYQDVRQTAIYIQGWALPYIARRQLRAALSSENKPPPEQILKMLGRALHLGATEEEGARDEKAEDDKVVAPVWIARFAGWVEVFVGDRGSPSASRWCTVRQGVFTVFSSSGASKVIATFDLARCEIKEEDGALIVSQPPLQLEPAPPESLQPPGGGASANGRAHAGPSEDSAGEARITIDDDDSAPAARQPAGFLSFFFSRGRRTKRRTSASSGTGRAQNCTREPMPRPPSSPPEDVPRRKKPLVAQLRFDGMQRAGSVLATPGKNLGKALARQTVARQTLAGNRGSTAPTPELLEGGAYGSDQRPLDDWAMLLASARQEARLCDSFRLQLFSSGVEDIQKFGLPAPQEVDEVVVEGYLWAKEKGSQKAWERGYYRLHNDGTLRRWAEGPTEEGKGPVGEAPSLEVQLRHVAMRCEDPDEKRDDGPKGAVGVQVSTLSSSVLSVVASRTLHLCSGDAELLLTTPVVDEFADWQHTLAACIAACYQLAPIIRTDAINIVVADGEVISVPAEQARRAADTIQFVCKQLGLANVSEWGLIERWDSATITHGRTWRRLPREELIVHETLLGWEQELRRRYGCLADAPATAFRLEMVKVTPLTTQARSKQEARLEYYQALSG